MTARELDGRTAIVTGAASGIGRAIATTLAKSGAGLILVDHNDEALGETISGLGDTGRPSVPVLGDVQDEATADRAVLAAYETFGGLQIVVNNAGIALVGNVEDTSPNDWDLVFATNVRGVYLFARAAMPYLRESGGGTIVSVASEAGLVGFSKYAAYSASKAAVVNLTRSMAVDHALDRIRVNCVCPGSIETPLLESYYAAQSDPKAARQEDERAHPLGIGRAEDVAEAVLYLVSDRSSYVTGHALVVDGGYTIQ